MKRRKKKTKQVKRKRKKSNRVKRKRKRSPNLSKSKKKVKLSAGVDARSVLEEEKSIRMVEPIPQEGSRLCFSAVEEKDAPAEEKAPLRGGQITFRNRKVRTMRILDSLYE